MTEISSDNPLRLDLDRVIDDGDMTGLQVVIVALCFCLMMLDGFDILAMSFAAPAIAEEWDLAGYQLGAVFSAAFFGMTLGAMFLGPLADRFGRRPVVIASVFSIGVAMTATGFVDSIGQLVVARAITGLGIGAMLASVTASVTEFTPDRHRNFAIGIVQSGYLIGAVSGGLIAAQIIPDFGWRAVFVGGGILTAAAGVAAIFGLPESMQFLLKNRPANAQQRINHILTRLNQARLTSLPAPTLESASTPSIAALLVPERMRKTTLLWAAFFLGFVTVYFALSWLPKILFDAGLSLDDSIYVSIATNVGGALGVIVVGRLSVVLGLARLIFMFLVAGAGCMIVFAAATANLSLPVLLLLTFFIGVFAFGGFASLYTVAARVYPAEVRTTGVGWAIGIGRIGAIIGPYVGGVLISLEFSTLAIFTTFTVPLVTAGICTVLIRLPESDQKQGATA